MQTKTIREITEVMIDYRGKTPEKTKSGVLLITAKVIKDGRIISENNEYISEDNYDSWMRRGLPKLKDILITTEAPLGEVAQLKKTEKVALAQRVILLRGNSQIVQDYYFHALKSPFVKAELNKRATGTTVLGIKQSELWMVEVPYHPLPTQQKIASILSAYDDLIENNTRRIQILEEMARRIYEEWFVHFRFPNHENIKLVESELGLIPEGWEVKKLGDVAIINGQTIKRGYEPDRIQYIDIASVSVGKINSAQDMFFNEAPNRARRIVKHGDIIWSNVRPNRKSFALILKPLENTVVSTGFTVLSATSSYYSFLYQVLTTDKFVDYLTNRAKGSAYPAVSIDDFFNANLIVSNEELLSSFDEIVKPMLLEKNVLLQKNNILSKTRDLLLPKLISGEIDVSEFPDP